MRLLCADWAVPCGTEERERICAAVPTPGPSGSVDEHRAQVRGEQRGALFSMMCVDRPSTGPTTLEELGC